MDNDVPHKHSDAVPSYAKFPPLPTRAPNEQGQMTGYPPDFHAAGEESYVLNVETYSSPPNSSLYSHYTHVHHLTETSAGFDTGGKLNPSGDSDVSLRNLGINSAHHSHFTPEYQQQRMVPRETSCPERQPAVSAGMMFPTSRTATAEFATTKQIGKNFTNQTFSQGTEHYLKYSEGKVRMPKEGQTSTSEPIISLKPTENVCKRHITNHPSSRSEMPALRQPVELVKGPPLYTKQLVLLFGASFFGMVPLLSDFSLKILLCGVVATYILDYLRFTRGTVIGLFATVSLFSAALFLSNIYSASSSIGPIFMILDFTALLVLAAAGATSHFRFLQDDYPELICTLDRLVMGLAPVLALPSFLSSSIVFAGSRRAPFCFLIVMCLESYFFYQPIYSNYNCVRRLVSEVDQVYMDEAKIHAPEKSKVPNSVADNKKASDPVAEEAELVAVQLNERAESIVFTFLILVVPITVYITLQGDFFDNFVPNLLNCFGLLGVALGYICMFPTHTFWFLAPDKGGTSERRDYHRLAYDPYRLEAFIRAYRLRIVLIVGISVVIWIAYRLVHCRYRYLFDGLPYPYNFFALLAALYTLLYVFFLTKDLLDADASGEIERVKDYTRKRIYAALGVTVVTLLVCLLMDAPVVFYFFGVLSVVSFNMFLLDRNAGGPIACFILSSSLLLMWWMHRTFSFIVLDLHVLGSSVVVSTQLVSVSVLFSYVWGWIGFAFAFHKSKILLILFLILHAMEVSFVEEVLYSQKEEGSYPALLVGVTSVVGIFMAYRLCMNKVLTVPPAALLASFYVAKVYVFLVEVTASYYEADLEWGRYMSVIRASEINVGWWLALFASYITTIFEIARRQRTTVRRAELLIWCYLFLSALLSLLTIRNIQRAVYEFLSRSHITADDLLHIAPGISLVSFSLLTLQFFYRHGTRYLLLRRLSTPVRFIGISGILLLVTQPTRISDYSGPFSENGAGQRDMGRYIALVGIFCLVFGCYVSLHRLPVVLRGLYWASAALALAFGITTTLLPIFTVGLLCSMTAGVFFVLLVIDFAHYREPLSVKIFFFYALFFFGIALSFMPFRQSNLLHVVDGNLPLMLDIYRKGHTHLLSMLIVVNLFLVILLRARLEGRAFLPGCSPLTPSSLAQLITLSNSALFCSVAALYLLNFLHNNAEPSLYASSSLLLVLFVNNDRIKCDFKAACFCNFLILSSSHTVLWLSFLSEDGYSGKGLAVLKSLASTLVFSLPLLLSHVSLSIRLCRSSAAYPTYLSESHLASSILLLVMLVNVLAFFLTSSITVQWMCIVTTCSASVHLMQIRVMHLKMESSSMQIG